VEWETIYDKDGIVIHVASKEAMLAMKLRANRPGRDTRDIRPLLALCDIRTLEDAEELYVSASGRSRNAATSSSRLAQIRDTSDFEMPVSAPSAFTRSSTLRVETPCTYASITTANRA
jgi:hypothetical protein